jgi:hypothetical protein
MLFYTYDKWSSIHSTIAVGEKTYNVVPQNETGQELDIGMIMGVMPGFATKVHFVPKKKLSIIPQDVLDAIGKLQSS